MSSAAGAILSSSDEDEVAEANTALLTGMTRAAEAEARRGRFFFDGVSGSAETPSSSSEADTTSESEKATLRFFALFVRAEEGVRFVPRIADLVGDAERDCEGVLVGVFFDAEAAPGASTLANFSRSFLIVARMDSFRSSQSSSIILKRRLKTLTGTPCLSANGMCCAVESWASWAGRGC
jgi:hypothetical protein